MITRSYNPVEPGAPAIWVLGGIGDNVRVPTFARDLRHYPEGDAPIDIFIESHGGFHSVGMDLYGLLRSLKRPKRVTVLAARSAAAVVAMAGDTIRIVEGGHFFLHHAHASGPSILALSDEHNLTAHVLRGLAAEIDAAEQVSTEILSRGLGADQRKFVTALKGLESTISARDAVVMGLADEVVPWPGASV